MILTHNLHEKTMSQADSFNTYYDVHKVVLNASLKAKEEQMKEIMDRLQVGTIIFPG